MAIEVVDYLITHNEDMGMVPKFSMALLKDIQKEGLSDYDSVNKFITSKLQNHDIDFSEFEMQRNIEMKHSTSVVTKGEVVK